MILINHESSTERVLLKLRAGGKKENRYHSKVPLKVKFFQSISLSVGLQLSDLDVFIMAGKED